MASLTLKIDKHLPVKNAEVLKVFMKKKKCYENISALTFFSYCLSQNVVYSKFLFFSTLRRLRVVSNKNCVIKVPMLFLKLIKL